MQNETGQNFPKISQMRKEALLQLPTPSFLIDLHLLEENLAFLQSVSQASGAKILLAQKAFSNYASYPLVAKYLQGTTASGLYEAKLAQRKMPNTEIHVFSPSYKKEDMEELLQFADHLVFNSLSQWRLHQARILAHQKEAKEQGKKVISVGLRINPAVSTGEHEIYNPCAAGSRLGILAEELRFAEQAQWLEGIDGLHFHTLCEQDAHPLLLTWEKVKEDFSFLFPRLKWLNMGGGHHITREGYNKELLLSILEDAKKHIQGDIYLEPGEAIALNAGFLLTKVEDLVKNEDFAAIMDMSPTCHTPDVIEMPYRPRLAPLYQDFSLEQLREIQARFPYSLTKHLSMEEAKKLRSQAKDFVLATEEKKEESFDYLLGGPSCLAGDVMGAYVFPAPLFPQDALLMGDMAIYSMVKTNTFNGIPLPSIYFYGSREQLMECMSEAFVAEHQVFFEKDSKEENNLYCLWKAFSYDEFERRL